MALVRLRKRTFIFLIAWFAVMCFVVNYLVPAKNERVPFRRKLKHQKYLVEDSVKADSPGTGSRMPLTLAVKKDPQLSNYSVKSHPWMFPRPLSELQGNNVPNQAFFVWCQNRTFTFNDYLSVLSVWKMNEPDKLEIHQGTDMQTDDYNQWVQELNRTIPVFSIKIIHRRISICRNPLYYMLEVLSDRGGMFVNFSTLFLHPVHHLRKQNFSLNFNVAGDVAFIVSKILASELRQVLSREHLHMKQTISMLKKSSVQYWEHCPSVSSSLPLQIQQKQGRSHVCVTLSSERLLKPVDLIQIPDENLVILKDVYFLDLRKGGENCAGELSREAGAIPSIVHYVWFGASEFSFRMYLSFLSTIHVAKAERVFIHCDMFLSGPYWKTVSKHPKVTVVYREAPREIFGHMILYTQHRSDIVRADVLDKYGGVYMDWDVLWLLSPASLLTSGHEVVLNLDHMPRPPFPDILNLGMLLSRPRARFIRMWRWELRNYRSKDFFYNALELPYKVYERHPDTAFVEKRLQVMCFWLKCHPIFHPDHKDWMRPQPFDWKTDAYTIHFTHPDPNEYQSIVALLNAKGTFAEIGMFILDVSGELNAPTLV